MTDLPHPVPAPAASDLPSGDSYAVVPEVVLTPDGPKRGLATIIEGGEFMAVDDSHRIAESHPAVPTWHLPGTAMIAGFVDCHQHPTQTFGKAIIGGQPAQIWKRIWLPLYDAMSVEATYVAAKWTCIEALRGGFTTIVAAGEIDEERSAAVEQAVVDVGIRCVLGHGFSDLADFESPAAESGLSTDDSIEAARAVASAQTASSRITTSLACASVQSATPELLTAIAGLSAEHGLLFQIHANEHTPEVDRSMERHGLRPIELLGSLDALGPQTLIAHATLATSSEISLMADRGAMVSYNPVASAWKGNAVAPALDFAATGVRFGLGTDATRNDGFRLMDAAETAQRLTAGMRIDDWWGRQRLAVGRRGNRGRRGSRRAPGCDRRYRAGEESRLSIARYDGTREHSKLGLRVGVGALLRPNPPARGLRRWRATRRRW